MWNVQSHFCRDSLRTTSYDSMQTNTISLHMDNSKLHMDNSKAVVPVLVLLFVALWFILRGDLFYVLSCVILFLYFFSPFSIAVTSLGE